VRAPRIANLLHFRDESPKIVAVLNARSTSRRGFLVGALSVVTARGASAQSRVYRVGYLAGGTSNAAAPWRAAFFGRLEELGYRVGHNLVVEFRFAAGQLDRLPALAAELVALKPDVLLTSATQATLAGRAATTTIPIVFLMVTDPEGLKIVKTLRQPGTNATGVANQMDEAHVKLVQMIREAFPAASELAILYNPLNTSEVRMLPALKQQAAASTLKLRLIEARTSGDLAPVFKALQARRPDVLSVMSGPLMFNERVRIVELANRQRQVTVYTMSEFVEAGGLMSYAPSFVDQHRAAAVFVDRILKGTPPAVLPVEQPTRFDLVLNLKTARTLDVTFPPAVLLRADRVIE
jgi:putative ABC transport system substrate-binding protein